MDMHRYSARDRAAGAVGDADRARPAAHGRAAGRPGRPGRAGGAGGRDDHARGPGRRSQRCGCGATCWRRPRCRSTTPATWPSFPAPPPRRPPCSTWWWARRRCTGAAGSRARAPSTPRTRRCAGSPTWWAWARAPAAASCRAAPSATCRRWWRPATPWASGLAAPRRPAGGRRSPTRRTARSIYALRNVMDVEPLLVEADERGRMTGQALRDAFAREGADGVFAVVATAGTTNLGVIDDLAGVADVCAEHGLWMHVDGAYGGAALAAPSVRHKFAGIERADSFIVDPHKWLFAPVRLLRAGLPRPAAGAARAHPARRLSRPDHGRGRVEPVRLRGAPVAARARAAVLVLAGRARHRRLPRRDRVDAGRSPARRAEEIRRRPELELLVEPELSVLPSAGSAGRRTTTTAWTQRLLSHGYAFVTPTSPPRRALHPLRDRQSAHHRIGSDRHPGHDVVALHCDENRPLH